METETMIGRPSSYTPEIGEDICERMANGKGLRAICEDEEMPSRTTVLRWLEKHADFRGHYARARDALLDFYSEEIVRIAFDDSGDFFIEDGKTIVDHAAVQRARLKVDALKWLLSKLGARKYGNNPELPPEPERQITLIQRTIVDANPAPPAPPPAQLAYDPGPLPKRVDPEILVRLVNLIKSRVPKADQRSPDALLDELFGVIDRALVAEYGSAAETASARNGK